MTLKIIDVIWLPHIIDKLSWKHGVTIDEAEQVLGSGRFYFAESGITEGEDVYFAAGRTDAGRYLLVFFIFKKTHDALILSAREMTPRERRRYAAKKS